MTGGGEVNCPRSSDSVYLRLWSVLEQLQMLILRHEEHGKAFGSVMDER